ncbi:MAG: IclR family transcriptional regulator [Actinobacteria bacterium]|nr:IclR family transcriptional regulator [Actinomycetota bacterium]
MLRLRSCLVEHRVSGVGVLDKSMAVLDAVAAGGPMTLAELVDATGLSRATAHRLAVALEAHGLVRRDDAGRFTLGLRLIGLGRRAAAGWPLAEAAAPVLAWLREQTGESVQLYVRDGDARLCVAALDSPEELRTIVPIGARLPLGVGSAGRLLAGQEVAAARPWVASVEERAPGVASVSAPVDVGGERVVLSVSGPIDRTTRRPGPRYGPALVEAAARLSATVAAGG